MRIFVLGVGGAGSLLAQLLARQGHTVWCGDRDPERARKLLGKKSKIEVVEANARNLWSIVRAARGCNLLVNASPAVFNEIILRAALRLRSHYLDLNSHLNRNPFRPEQFRFQKRFAAKHRAAVICTGIVCGSLSFDRDSLKPIPQLLPNFILMKADQARTLALHTTVQALASEMEEQAPGSEVVASRLAEVLFI